jgi:hypothetical protein
MDNQDRGDFLACSGNNVAGIHHSCHTWSLLRDHFHLLLQTDSVPGDTFHRGMP